MKRLIIDIYGEIDENDIGKPLELEIGEIWCPVTGEQYKGTITINNIKVARVDNLDREP